MNVFRDYGGHRHVANRHRALSVAENPIDPVKWGALAAAFEGHPVVLRSCSNGAA